MTEILIGTNLLTLALLGMALRAGWLWRQASRKPSHPAHHIVINEMPTDQEFGLVCRRHNFKGYV